MPFVDESDRFATAGLGDANINRDPEDTGPDLEFWSDVIPAAFRRENIIGSFASSIKSNVDTTEVSRPQFDPFREIEGYQEYAGAFIGADSMIDVHRIKLGIDRERKDLDTLQQSGAMGVGAMLAAGVLDPITFLPVGGILAKSVKGGKVLKGALATSAATMTAVTASEAVLHATQMDRTLTESAFNVTGAALLGGVMGGAVTMLSKRKFSQLARLIDEEDPQIMGGRSLDDVDVPAEKLSEDFEGVQNLTGRTAREEAVLDSGILKKIPLLKHLNPMLRILLKSRSAVSIAYLQNLTATPFRFVKNLSGKVGVQVVRRPGTKTDPWRPMGATGRGKLKPSVKQGKGAIDAAEEGLDILEETSHADLIEQGLIGPDTRFADKAEAVQDARRRLDSLREGELERTGTTKGVPEARALRMQRDKERRAAEIVRRKAILRLPRGERAAARRALKEELEALDAEAAEGAAPEGLFAAGENVEILKMRGSDGGELYVRNESGVEGWIHKERLEQDLSEPVMRKPGEGETFRTEELGEPIVREAPAEVSAESKVDAMRVWLYDAITAQNELWIKYRERIAGKPMRGPAALKRVRINLGDFRRGRNKEIDFERLTERQFLELAGRAARTNDEIASTGVLTIDRLAELCPEAAEVAKVYRQKVIQPMLARAMGAGLLTSGLDNLTAPSYFTRVWKQQALIDNREVFLDITSTWLSKSHPEILPGELRAAAEKIHSTLTGTPGGRISWEPIELTIAGSLQRRSFTIQDELLQRHGFLEDDIELVMTHYWRTMAPDVALAETFGGKGISPFDAINMSRVKSDILEDYGKKIDLAERTLPKEDVEKATRALRRQSARDVEDLEAMRDSLRGTYLAPTNPESIPVRAVRFARATNLLAQGGGFMISSMADVARPVMVHGLNRTIRTSMVPVIRNFRTLKLAKEELRRIGIGLESVLDTRAQSMMDLGDNFGPQTKFEAGTQLMARKYSLVNMLSPWNTMVKQWSGIVTQARILEAVEAISRAGDDLSPSLLKDRSNLAFQRIDKQATLDIAEQFRRHGEIKDGFYLANTQKWDNHAARELYAAAVRDEVDRIIVTPGIGDRPLWMSSEGGKTVMQYKSFAFSAVNRVMAAGIQQRDMATLNGLFISVAMGSGIYAFKTKEAGRELSDDPLVWFREGIDRSGIVGAYSDLFNVLDKVNLGPNRITGGPMSSRYASRNVISSLWGPTAGLVETGITLAAGTAGGDWSQRHTREARKLIWAQNLVGWRHLMDRVEQGVNEEFGIDE